MGSKFGPDKFKPNSWCMSFYKLITAVFLVQRGSWYLTRLGYIVCSMFHALYLAAAWAGTSTAMFVQLQCSVPQYFKSNYAISHTDDSRPWPYIVETFAATYCTIAADSLPKINLWYCLMAPPRLRHLVARIAKPGSHKVVSVTA